MRTHWRATNLSLGKRAPAKIADAIGITPPHTQGGPSSFKRRRCQLALEGAFSILLAPINLHSHSVFVCKRRDDSLRRSIEFGGIACMGRSW